MAYVDLNNNYKIVYDPDQVLKFIRIFKPTNENNSLLLNYSLVESTIKFTRWSSIT